jgi:hypothetical protein
MMRIDVERANHFLLAKQHLTPASRADDLLSVTRDVGGLHATAVSTPYLSLFSRVLNFSQPDLDRAMYERRTLAKIRCVRKTIYIQPADWIPVFYAATASAVAGASERFMHARGVSRAQFERLRSEILEMLHGTEMTATQIRDHLQTDLHIPSILYALCDRYDLIRARSLSWRDKRHTYARFRDYFPDLDLDTHTEDQAKPLLIQHYLGAFGPATEADIAWWTGFGARDVKRALEELAEQIMAVEIPPFERKHLLLKSDEPSLQQMAIPAAPQVSFLPVLDPLLMGYKFRERFLDSRHQAYVFDRSGNATSTIIFSGRVAGVWDYQTHGEPAIKVHFFDEVSDEIRDRIKGEAYALGKFIFEEGAGVVPCSTMTPLTERTAGSMMSPLKDCPQTSEH